MNEAEGAGRGRGRARQRLTHAIRRQSAEYRSPATLRTNAEASTMPRLFIIASHIVVIVIIMILYRFPLSVVVVAVLFHGPRLVWALGARRSHVSRGKRVFLADILSVLCAFRVLCVARARVTNARRCQWNPPRIECRQSADHTICYSYTCVVVI